MIIISVLLLVCLLLAWQSEQKTKEILSQGYRYSVWNDNAFLLLVLILVLFTGLRIDFNDTWNYVNGFRKAPSLPELLQDPDITNPFKNPLFYIFQSLIKDLTGNPYVMIFTASAITQISFLLFFKRYSTNFTFSIFIYFTLGTFCMTMGALKQTFAMAILAFAFPYLERKQFVRYYLLVFIAMLFHTYAICYAVLPLFFTRPWKLFTYVFVALVAVLMMNFTDVITEFMDQANDLGKTLEAYEILDSPSTNLLRVGVYAAPPLVSLLFQRYIFRESDGMDHILVHMGVISFSFMLMGTQSGANMFGRMAQYFELGTLCCLPWMLKKPFDRPSYRLVLTVVVVCFLGFFVYANGINFRFDDGFDAFFLLN